MYEHMNLNQIYAALKTQEERDLVTKHLLYLEGHINEKPTRPLTDVAFFREMSGAVAQETANEAANVVQDSAVTPAANSENITSPASSENNTNVTITVNNPAVTNDDLTGHTDPELTVSDEVEPTDADTIDVVHMPEPANSVQTVVTSSAEDNTAAASVVANTPKNKITQKAGSNSDSEQNSNSIFSQLLAPGKFTFGFGSNSKPSVDATPQVLSPQITEPETLLPEEEKFLSSGPSSDPSAVEAINLSQPTALSSDNPSDEV
jgi:hypothetical protein